jgi:FHS family L-fucose permease-like MFS transporter
MKYVRPTTLMTLYALINIVFVSIAVVHPGWVGVWLIFLTSFFMSLMYPTIFALGVQGLGADSKVGGSLIVMAIIGGAVLTPLMGIISDVTKSIALAYGVPLVGYAYIGCYAFFAHRRAPAAQSLLCAEEYVATIEP